MAILLKARPVCDQRVQKLKGRCRELRSRGVTPTMKVLLVGEHPPSLVYTRRKKNLVETCGGVCEILSLPEKVAEEHFLAALQEAADDPGVHGCFVQLPLPGHLTRLDLGSKIPPGKDVDGFHPQNLYGVLTGRRGLLPCTPKGVLTLLKAYRIEVAGKKIAVIGRSLIVGKPMALLLLNHNATVSVCHSHTPRLEDYTHAADIIISAVGRARFFTAPLLNPDRRDQILVDVGINHDNGLCGDMDFENLEPLCGAITPVPGGVGPMTVLSLVENLVAAAEGSC